MYLLEFWTKKGLSLFPRLFNDFFFFFISTDSRILLLLWVLIILDVATIGLVFSLSFVCVWEAPAPAFATTWKHCFSNSAACRMSLSLPQLLVSSVGAQGRQPSKYARVAYWLFWIKFTWKTGFTKRALWLSVVSLNAGNKSPLWKMPSLPPEAERGRPPLAPDLQQSGPRSLCKQTSSRFFFN